MRARGSWPGGAAREPRQDLPPAGTDNALSAPIDSVQAPAVGVTGCSSMSLRKERRLRAVRQSTFNCPSIRFVVFDGEPVCNEQPIEEFDPGSD
jgi:hypothetical protein